MRHRIYKEILSNHFQQCRQMAFVAGPRQVGKTTTCRELGDVYFDWDNDSHRRLILAGPDDVAVHCRLEQLAEKPVRIIFDELHKYGHWKRFLKGFFDTYEALCQVIVTGSSRLDVYRRSGDSLMGRYFLFHMHPLSVGEIVGSNITENLTQKPRRISDDDWDALWRHGGFPEPFVQRNQRFSMRWHKSRHGQLFREDVRDLTRIQEVARLETLGDILADRSGDQLIYSHLAGAIQISEKTVRSWIDSLCGLHYGFIVRPWFANLSKTLRKEPKWFLRDWSSIVDEGKRAETFIACHLLKAVDTWNDLGLGDFELRYIRDRQKREVDFVVIKNHTPWLLAEVKLADITINPVLRYFQRETGAPFAFQIVVTAPYVDADCFATEQSPIAVPAKTFLSQLV